MEFGAQLYSVRNDIQNREDILKTFDRLSKMGYKYIHHSGNDIFKFKNEMLEAAKAYSLPIVLTHVGFNDLKNRIEETMALHRDLDCKYIGLGAMPAEYYEKKQVEKFVEEFNLIGEVLRKNGFDLFYHNHGFEFDKMPSGKIIFDYMIENARNYSFTADTYWIQFGGGNVAEYLKKLKGKCACIHLKDYICRGWQPAIAAVGDGILDFKSLIKEAINSKAEYFFVEQDNAVDFPDPFNEMQKSITHLKAL